ncbi:putative exonuclease GOR [Nymphon striatum]|nr:putative exonuclease GOR [Nymphon striatum]
MAIALLMSLVFTTGGRSVDEDKLSEIVIMTSNLWILDQYLQKPIYSWRRFVPSGSNYFADKNTPEKELKAYAVDCEMCTTASGMELIHVTVVNKSLEVVYDTHVKPPRPIIDYNTHFSGITEKDLEGVHTTLKDVQNKLMELFCSKTFLIGHSLDSDLLALKMRRMKRSVSSPTKTVVLDLAATTDVTTINTSESSLAWMV